MVRNPRENVMERRPPDCACGAQAARAEVARRLCHVCRIITTEHPEMALADVAAAGRKRWAELEARGAAFREAVTA